MAHFDLNKIIVRFKIKYPRFEYIVDTLPIELDDSISTACTDGEKLYFNKEFMETLDEEQQLFTFSHEVLHVALNHIDRCLDKNMYYWNIATDAVINDYLRNSGLKAIDNCVDIEGALNQTAEELYEKLLQEDEDKKDDEPKEAEETDKKGNGKPSNSPSSGNGDNDSDKDKDGNGSSDNEDDDKDKDKDGNDSSKNGDDDNDKDGDKKNTNAGHDDHSKWKDAAKKHKEEGTDNKNKVDDNEEFKKNDDEKKKQNDDYLKNGLDGAKSSPYGKGQGRGTIGGIETIDESPICWQDLLKMNYKSNPDWETSDEVEYGVLIDNLVDNESSECEIVIDSSGSVSENLIRNFLTECLNIAKNNKIKVGFFDTEFYGFHEIRDEEDINELKIEGGGGTDFNCAVEAFTDSCENKIIFTDGGARMPDKEVDATWIVFDYYKHEINPKGGDVIYINGDEYDNLLYKHRTR